MKYKNGHDFEFKALRPSDIFRDELYQRPIDRARVDRIVNDFNGDVFNEPKVSYRDGKYWCFDGDHSIAAWNKLYKGQDRPMLCKVFKGMTWLDECETFLKQRGEAQDVTVRQMIKAASNARREDVMRMVQGAKAAGFEVSFDLSKGPYKICAVAALYKACNTLGLNRYVDMLDTIRTAWNGDMQGISAIIINAMTRVFANYGHIFKTEDMAKSLGAVRPIDLIREGRNSRTGVDGQIIKAYNKRRKTRRIEIDD